jgi:hypothetical protein
MKVSITAVSANRQMTKTLVRASEDVKRLRGAFSHIDASGEPFDTVQFVLMDRPGSYIHLEGIQGGDRLFQVHLGASDFRCGLGRERDFVAGLARAFLGAIGHLPVSELTAREMRRAIERLGAEYGDAPNDGPTASLSKAESPGGPPSVS